MSETQTRTYSVQISDETFQQMKELEKATGIPREHIFTAMVDILAEKNSQVVNQVVTKAMDFQKSALEAKMKNGGFFTGLSAETPKKVDTPKGDIKTDVKTPQQTPKQG